MIIRRTTRWLDDRLGASSFARTALDKVFPDHWSFMLGEIALYCFAILVLTGIYLSLFFVPSSRNVVYQGTYAPLRGIGVSEAYASVLRISFEVRAGMVFRQMHHWAAVVFVAAIVLHLCRIFFTGAFRRPREINWIIGITLLLLALFNGFTGYSLPDDLLSGTGLRIAYSIALSIPAVGTWLAFLVFGGEFPAHDIISRLYVIHIFLVPAALATLIGIHLALIWHQKHTQFPGPGRTETNVVGSRLWPTYAMKSVALFFAVGAVLGLLGGLAQINPIWLYGPFVPQAVSSPAQPDWYLGWLEGALRLFPNWEIRAFGHTVANPFFPAVLLPGITFLLLYLWPFLEQRVTGDRLHHDLLDRPRDRPVRTGLGAAALSFYGVLFFAASNDVIAKLFKVPVTGVTWVFRILVVALPPLVGAGVYRFMLGAKVTGAESLLEVPFSAMIRPRPSPDGEGSNGPNMRRCGVSDELVQVWRQSDGSWRWRYVVLDHTELRSNRGYESVEEAIHSARQAYPGVVILGPLENPPRGDGDRPSRRRAGAVRIALVSATTVFVGLAAWYALRRFGAPVHRSRRRGRRGR